MKNAKKHLVLLFCTILIVMSFSGCETTVDKLHEIEMIFDNIISSIESESIIENTESETVFDSTIQNTINFNETNSFGVTQESTNSSLENTQDTNEIITETTSGSISQSDILLKAESFTREDIIANGPLYARRDQFDPQFIEDALEYFPEIAGGNEFDPTIPEVLNRWDTMIPIKIGTFGEPTAADFARLDLIIPAVETLTGLNIQYVEAGSTDYNFEFHIAPLEDFDEIFEGLYIEGNWGFVIHWHDSYGYNNYARMAVSNDYPNREEMNHLIMEEFIQALGLPNDSYRYEDSLFQQNWTATQELMPIDWLLLEFVYRPELTPNMSVYQCVEILRELYLD